MHVEITQQALHQLAHERQRRARADNLAAGLAAVRKWERRAAAASRRAGLARAALR